LRDNGPALSQMHLERAHLSAHTLTYTFSHIHDIHVHTSVAQAHVRCCTCTHEQLEDLKVAWLAVKHVKSNAITVVKDKKLLGMGSGQPNRVNSVGDAGWVVPDGGYLLCLEPDWMGTREVGG